MTAISRSTVNNGGSVSKVKGLMCYDSRSYSVNYLESRKNVHSPMSGVSRGIT